MPVALTREYKHKLHLHDRHLPGRQRKGCIMESITFHCSGDSSSPEAQGPWTHGPRCQDMLDLVVVKPNGRPEALYTIEVNRKGSTQGW